MSLNSTPSENRPRSYSGGYMEVGKNGERIVLDWLEKNPNIVGVKDLRELRAMQEADVDCMITLWKGNVRLAEIKTDNHLGKSPNVLFEILRINHTAHPDNAATLGWSMRSPAKLLFFYAQSVNKIYHCDFDNYRHVFQEYTKNVRKNTNINYVSTDDHKSTINILIPWTYCKDIFTIEDLP